MEFLPPFRAWAEVNLDRLVHNYKELCKAAKSAKVMCVVKANAYGHGAVICAKRLEAAGCIQFGVATLEEAVELRKNGIKSKILLLTHLDKNRICDALDENIDLTVFSLELAEAISLSAKSPVNIHIKLDTGLNRIGFKPNEAIRKIIEINSLPNINIEGVFTHFASSFADDTTYTEFQTDVFEKICGELTNAGINVGLKHAANSAAVILHPTTHFDMVRVGISLYGCYPFNDTEKTNVKLLPCMQLKAGINRLIDLGPGEAVSYSGLFVTKRPTKLATIPIGYADGVSGVLTGKLKVLVNGQVAPVVGKICMDQCMIDVTDVQGDVAVGDEVVIFGEQKGGFIPVEQPAGQIGTINYEMLCLVSRRVPRYYTQDGKIVSKEDFSGNY